MIKWVSGDLFANEYQAQALAHGCNCIGFMGAGIAATMRRHYPQMYKLYAIKCLSRPRTFRPGDCWLYTHVAPHAPVVFNLATQEDVRRRLATPEAIAASLISMVAQADDHGITTIALPRIGSGLGGLDWETEVRPIVGRILNPWSGTAYVYEEYLPG